MWGFSRLTWSFSLAYYLSCTGELIKFMKLRYFISAKSKTRPDRLVRGYEIMDWKIGWNILFTKCLWQMFDCLTLVKLTFSRHPNDKRAHILKSILWQFLYDINTRTKLSVRVDRAKISFCRWQLLLITEFDSYGLLLYMYHLKL